MPSQDGVTQAEYARSRGLSAQYVGRLQKRGVVVVMANGKINPQASDEARARMITPRMRRTVPNSSKDDFFKARAAREHYSAELARLEYERQSGKLCDADLFFEKALAAFSNCRARLLGLSRSLAPLLAAQSSVAAVERILFDGITGALITLSTDIFALDAPKEKGDPNVPSVVQ
jgi:hypothetical protein